MFFSFFFFFSVLFVQEEFFLGLWEVCCPLKVLYGFWVFVSLLSAFEPIFRV